jgi:hypothetical protein
MAESGGGGGAGGAGGGGASAGTAGGASSPGGSSTGSAGLGGGTTQNNSAQSADMSAAMGQTRDAGITSGKSGISPSTETRGPDSGTELNTGGGWKLETTPVESSTQKDGRSAVDQASSAGQTLKDQGVKTESSLSQAESKTRLDSTLGNNTQTTSTDSPGYSQPGKDIGAGRGDSWRTDQSNTTPQSDAAFKQAAETSKPAETTVNQSQNTPSP